MKLKETSDIIERQVHIVDEILSRYVDDEAGASQKELYKSMTPTEKLELLTYTIESCCHWEDFETDLVENFDMGCY